MVSNNLIIEKIWDTFEKELPNFLKNDFGFYREYFLKNSLLMNEKIKVKQIQNIIEGKVVDISNSGELILKTDDSRLININSGEIIFKNV